MKSVFVVAPSADWKDQPAFRIRLAALVAPLARRGFTLDIRPRPKGPLGRLRFARDSRGFHAVILHRKWLDPYEARALRRSIGPGKIVMDIDDATMYHETALGSLARRRLDRRFRATLKVLDLACTGNEYLGDIFRKRGIATRLIP